MPTAVIRGMAILKKAGVSFGVMQEERCHGEVARRLLQLTAAQGGTLVLGAIGILLNLVLKGAGSLSLDFFTKTPAPAGETGGGVAHALVGTLLIVGLASLIGLPIGIGAGIYCAEYATNRLTWITRFVADVMNGTPSIVVGVFAWAWIVARQKHFSALAGSVALALLMIPMVMRTTEEMIKLVPNSLREAALALGYPRWRTSLSVVIRTTLPGGSCSSNWSTARATYSRSLDSSVTLTLYSVLKNSG